VILVRRGVREKGEGGRVREKGEGWEGGGEERGREKQRRGKNLR
jgi:hypothetical protein